MPLCSPIGSDQGLNNLVKIQMIIENANIPIIIVAEIGLLSKATLANLIKSKIIFCGKFLNDNFCYKFAFHI